MSSSPDTPKAALSPAEQARIRRERRQAKVLQGAGSRLDKITSTQGLTYRTHEDLKLPVSPSPTPPPAPASESGRDASPALDPPDVDISSPSHQHQPPPPLTRRGLEPGDELAMMQQLMGGQLPPGMENDPMFKLLASMGGGMGGGFPGGPQGGDMGGMGGGGMPDMGGMPPGLAAMAGMAGMQGGPAQQASGPTTQDWLWRILHGVATMMLTIWVLTKSMSGFDGKELSREKGLVEGARPDLFWYFATMELVLQSTRFMLEKGRPPQNSWLTMIAGFLPPPFSTYLTTGARYLTFINVIMADAGVVIFVLGMAAWWNS